MKRKSFTITLMALLVLLLSVGGVTGQGPEPEGEVRPEEDISAAAMVGSLISYQGRLTEGGSPVTGPRDMVFRFYSNSSCSTQVWDVVRNDVLVEDGLFSVKLGVNQDHFNGQGLWLRVLVGGTTVVSCEEILPVPYALSLRPGAEIADTNTEVKLNLYTYTVIPPFSLTSKYGIRSQVSGSYNYGYGVYGYSSAGNLGSYGVYGQSDSTSGRGVHGHATASSGTTYGVYGRSDSASGAGVYGYSPASHGVEGHGCSSADCYGGYFEGTGGIKAEASGGGEAGRFIGHVYISGKLDVGGTAGFSSPVWFHKPVTFEQPIEITNYATFWRSAEFEDMLISQQLYVEETAEFEGSVEFHGPVTGSFPRPAWSSGWVSMPQAEWTTLTHNLGGDPDSDYFVDMQCKADGWGINNRGVGGHPVDRLDLKGASYNDLTSSSVKVYRFRQDDLCSQVRIRIWVIQ